MGNCQQTEGLHSRGDSSASIAARCNAHPAPPANPGRLRKMHAPSITRVWRRSASRKMPPSFGVVLEAGRRQRGRERRDHPGLILVTEVSTDRAASLAEVFGGFRQDPAAAAAPDARPVRRKKLPIEPPDDVAGVDLLNHRIHRSSVASAEWAKSSR